MRIIDVTTAVARAMREHAQEEWPREACGAVFGAGRTARILGAVYRPLTNRSAFPHQRFEADPFELCRADGEERDAGRELLGLFHSHPGGSADPSERDRAADWPALACWIASIDADGGFDLAVHRLARGRITDQKRSV